MSQTLPGDPATPGGTGDAPSSVTLTIEATGPLSGRIRIGGAKNSALKLMAATLLAPGNHRLTNVPRIADVEWMVDILRAVGSTVSWAEPGVVDMVTPDSLDPEPPVAPVARMRASTALLGPLLSRCGHVKLALPGGDDFGARPVNLHVDALRAMGAEVLVDDSSIVASAGRLNGAHVRFDYPSVGATETVLLAAATARGDTVIENAAREPEIADLAAFLNRMGARVLGAGSSTVRVSGVGALGVATHQVVADRLEAATFVCAVGAAGGEILLTGARDDHLTQLIRTVGRAGVRCAPDADGVWVMAHPPGSADRLVPVSVATLPYPGIATDYLPLLVGMLTVADGTSYATENLYTGRFRYITELARLGADLSIDGHHIVIRGVPKLSASTVVAHDIRAGAALVIASLVADGPCEIREAQHLDRGYEDLDAKLSALGVSVGRRSH